jgi:hypothetical protein
MLITTKPKRAQPLKEVELEYNVSLTSEIVNSPVATLKTKNEQIKMQCKAVGFSHA